MFFFDCVVDAYLEVCCFCTAPVLAVTAGTYVYPLQVCGTFLHLFTFLTPEGYFLLL